jgi:nucleoid-associated protein YgaU
VDRENLKISFNSTPSAPTQTEGKPRIIRVKQDAADQLTDERGPSASIKTTAISDTLAPFNREEWEKQLMAPKPVVKPAPKAPSFATAGLMARHQPGFWERNARKIGVVAVVGTTIPLGLVVAFMMFEDGAAAPQQAAGVEEFVQETFSDASTRAVIADMTDVSAAVSIPAGATAPIAADLNAAVLAGLKPAMRPVARPAEMQTVPVKAMQVNEAPAKAALEILSDAKLRMLREGILADSYDIEPYQREGIQRVRVRIPNAPLIDTASSELFLEAVARGDIEMSPSLLTSSGDVDVETMIFNLVQKSFMNDETPEASEAALDMSRKVFAASPARTEIVGGTRYYTVQKGDSLAYIAMQFYGRPAAFDRILEVNRNTLQSPDKIQTGQRLIIPG